MNPATTPVLLVVKAEKLPNVRAVIDSFRRHTDLRRFYLVCPPHDLATARAVGDEPAVQAIDEESVIPGLSCSVVCEHLPAHVPGWPARSLAGWYYQQFLKFGFARWPFGGAHYLIWDADTLLTRPVSFYEQGAVLLTSSNEYHRDYFATLRKLLPQMPAQPRSHISQHALVRAADMSELLDELASHGLPWWQYILSCLQGTTPQQFSEYETYAGYCLWRWPKRYRSVRRRWLRSGTAYFRSGMQGADVSRLADVYDFVAFEDWDVGPRRQRRARWRVARARAATWLRRQLRLPSGPRLR